ncbi:MAG: prolipoprotein diacylglyceryl transferase [Nitrospiraceae bacterium]|nr:MAG: prolipoprotein diacylglyceryl transferase [Nitrospiraceae bacterium]
MFPILFQIGPVTVHTYGLLVATGFIVGISLAVHFGKKEGLRKETILDIGFYSLVSAIVGSRLLFVLIEYRHFFQNPLEIFKIWEGGLVFYGGLLLVIPVLFFYFKRHTLPTWKMLDILAPCLAIGHAIGRIGCFSAGCCYGRPTQLPWGITFTHPHSMATTGIALHPTQLYESVAEFIIFVFIIAFNRHKRFNGQILWLYILLYSGMRFFIEFFRGDSERGMIYSNFSIAQGVSIALFGAALYFLVSQRRKIVME